MTRTGRFSTGLFAGCRLHRKKRPLGRFCLWWAIRDSNPGPTGYEPVALTN